MKRCCTCRQEKAAGEFWRSSATKDGLAIRCKDCDRTARKAWRDGVKAQPLRVGVDVIVCDRERRGRGVNHCGFPDGHGVCGLPVPATSISNVREGLSYCEPHYERAMAAKESAKQRTSASGKGVDTSLDTRAVAGQAARPENRSAASRRGA
jgi:hypothetical protein